jgi:hypothetical protein
VRIAVQLVVSGGVIAFLLWQLDLRRTFELVGESDVRYVVAAFGLFLLTTWVLARRWQILLASKGIHEPIGWLVKLYFVAYAAGQVLPTALGGDAVRYIDHARRRPTARGEAAGAIVMERVVGSAGTLILVAVGLALAAGRYDDIALLVWLEVAFVAAMVVFGVLLFYPPAARGLQGRVFPLLRHLRLERLLASLYGAMHGYRHQPGALLAALGLTLVTQIGRIAGIWLCGEAIGVDVSPLVYLILGPLLFLIMMVPFTINGLGVREAFFIAFLDRFGVDAEAAFATGFLFYAVTLATALPGALILLWRSARPAFAGPRAD